MAMEQRGPAVSVEKATNADIPRLAQTLARAFYDDPTIRWMVPDDERRLRPLDDGLWRDARGTEVRAAGNRRKAAMKIAAGAARFQAAGGHHVESQSARLDVHTRTICAPPERTVNI